MVCVESVTQHFCADGQTTIALENVDFQVPAGQFVSLVGPSGCGKSTLLFQVAGLRQPTSGMIRCSGESITAPMPQKIGMIFQEANLLPWLTAVENVAFPLKLRGVAKRERNETAARMLQLTGLAEAFNALNHRNNLTRNGTFGAGAFPSNPSASFGQVTAVHDPRSLQVAARIRF
jgi:ABC-type nitrate/sulfonate/bicarbonate transport system ATPase subunit